MILKKDEIKACHPNYIGFQILENSKHTMINFFYNVIKKFYGDSIQLLYTDTDSFVCGSIGIPDIYEEFKSGHLKNHMDLSNFSVNSPYFDDSVKSKLSYLKDEMGGRIINECIFLQAKSYSLLLDSFEEKITSKGVPKCLHKNLKHDFYRKLLKCEEEYYRECFTRIQSKNFVIRNQNISKITLSCFDDKRFYVNNIQSHAYGHPNISNSNNMDSS